MAGVDVGGGGSKRQMNADINMIPFIDLLMVTVAFLLITAVWVTNSRLDANAQVPGNNDDVVTPDTVEKVMHVHASPTEFSLVWKQGATVVSETKVARPEAREGEDVRFTALEEAVAAEWNRFGGHRDASDKKMDRAVLHTDDRVPFKEIAGVLDAVAATKRELADGRGKTVQVPAFDATFAVR